MFPHRPIAPAIRLAPLAHGLWPFKKPNPIYAIYKNKAVL